MRWDRIQKQNHKTLGLFWPKVSSCIFLLCLVPFISSSISISYAQTTEPTTPSDVSIEDFDKICKEVLAASPNPSAADTQTQKLQYCQSALSSKEGSDAQSALWKVWAAVGAVCVAACAASFAGIANQYVCIATNVAAGVATGVITKDFMNALVPIMTAGGGLMANSMIGSSSTGNQPGTKEKDIGACLIGAQAAYQAYSAHSKMKTQLEAARGNLENAQSVSASTAGVVGASVNSNPTTATNGSLIAMGGSTGTVQPMTPIAAAQPLNYSANPCSNSSNAGMVIQCAIANNSEIPKYVNSPKFASDFKKASGMPLGDFFAKNDPPTKAMATTMGGTLSSGDGIKLTAALQKMEEQISREIPSSRYAGGGSGRSRSSGGGGDDSLGDMANLMSQFMPKQKEEGQQSGLSSVIFANEHRPSTTIAEDRTLSIFDRITYRYYFVVLKMANRGVNP